MKRLIIYIITILLFSFGMQAQELNTKLTINTQRLPTPSKELFASLESNLIRILNDQKWSNVTFNQNERINCTMTITVNEMTAENAFKGEIQVTSSRPAYNSTYVTTMFNFRDTQFEFKYMQGESLDFNSLNIDNNIVAVISFYANIILGLDFDSFSLNGGKPYFAKATEIANMAQSLNTKGWEPFSGKNNNRYDLAMALTEESSSSFHDMWYAYHRTGLDEMVSNASRGRIRAMEAFTGLNKLYEARPSSILLTVIGDTKLDEIVRISSQGTTEEKRSMKDMLSKFFPTRGAIIKGLE
ncbi:hypothetical protein GGR21_001924 [Dysgonomonas hofstadii]|uniref:DUF4835 domain-containing protein n=1 Tax=Dysgonomonas hofstadii TaxID=637886 RepID=A0A840CW32_9BACT|nr:DUF4835 family protein [Dysgonomonas hofstadii]MBB4036023.1 hypothetical protein [Dysgonomonas hofstadii]